MAARPSAHMQKITNMFKVEKTWISPEWEERLKEADLLDIEAVSEREFNWFEAPNRRRGGWSGVTRIVLNPEAVPEEQKAVFLKIQQNHFWVICKHESGPPVLIQHPKVGFQMMITPVEMSGGYPQLTVKQCIFLMKFV